jgi:hypothetical protein
MAIVSGAETPDALACCRAIWTVYAASEEQETANPPNSRAFGFIQPPFTATTYTGVINARLISGQALHGYRLTLKHPKTEERMVFYASLPDYFMLALKKAGESGSEPEVLAKLKQLERTDLA